MLKLPENVFSRKIPYRGGYAYEFEHRALGELGRIFIEGVDAKNCILKSEVVKSHEDDPRGSLRLSLFQSISESISKAMVTTVGEGALPAGYEEKRRAVEREVIKSKLCLCKCCEKPIFNMIFYPEASRSLDFVNTKRKLYDQLLKLNVEAYVLGMAGADGRHYIYKVWPDEIELGFMDADSFNNMTGEYCAECRQ